MCLQIMCLQIGIYCSVRSQISTVCIFTMDKPRQRTQLAKSVSKASDWRRETPFNLTNNDVSTQSPFLNSSYSRNQECRADFRRILEKRKPPDSNKILNVL